MGDNSSKEGNDSMFLIGEFSKLARVSRRMLYYYEEVGLLMPAHIEQETGYRYYSATQLPRLNQILALKELGLTLVQIRQMLNDDISADELRGMLALRRTQIEQNLQDEVMRLRYIESRIRQIEAEGVMRDYDVVLKSVAALQVLTVRETLADMSGFAPVMFEMLHRLPDQLGSAVLGPMIAIVHSDEHMVEQIDAEMGFVLQGDTSEAVTVPSGRTLTTRALPAVTTMATAVRTGPTPLNSGCYHAIGNWMETHGYRMAGLGREVFIELNPNDLEAMVVEVQFPVERYSPTHSLLL
jgi:DNA-binding transcriptional MerR regulator